MTFPYTFCAVTDGVVVRYNVGVQRLRVARRPRGQLTPLASDRMPGGGAPPPSEPPKTPIRPVSAPGKPVRYLTDEQKAALNAKYGQIETPKAADLAQVANSGCKMQ